MVLLPHSFFFSLIYIILLYVLSYLTDFFYFWVLMEVSTLVFMGISYSVFKNNFSFLLIFFIIQTISAFFLLIFFIYPYPTLMSFSMFLKLSMFPFHFWFLSLMNYFPNFVLFISMTIYKIPPIFMLSMFNMSFSFVTMIWSSILTLFVGGLMAIFSNDMRFILLSSSVANNSWFFLSLCCGLFTFFVFWIIYSIFIFGFILCFLKNMNSLSFKLGSSSKLFIVLLLFSVSGLPPFPIFFMKMFIIYQLFNYFYTVHLVFMLLSTLILLLGYMKYCFFYMSSFYLNSFFLIF